MDPWLRNGDWGFVTSLVAMGVEDLVVSDLIDHNAHVWRTNIINGLFNERDVKTIASMPIINEVEEDKHLWNFTPHGEYNVSSAYRHVMENLVDNTNFCVESSWTKLWHLKVPQKVKVFLWRVACGCLPTKYCLQTRSV